MKKKGKKEKEIVFARLSQHPPRHGPVTVPRHSPPLSLPLFLKIYNENQLLTALAYVCLDTILFMFLFITPEN